MQARRPGITVIIPSIGYPTLEATLASITRQELSDRDQIFVVGDGPQPESEALLNRTVAGLYQEGRFEPDFFYREVPYTGNWGNPNRNAILAGDEIRIGNLLAWMDEDDVFLPCAFETLRERAQEAGGGPFMVKGIWPDGRIIWWEKVIQRCWIGGHNFVVPYYPAKTGRWGATYEGDFDFIRSTLDLWGDDPPVAWFEDLISDHRPHAKGR